MNPEGEATSREFTRESSSSDASSEGEILPATARNVANVRDPVAPAAAHDPVEAALAKALEGATLAQRWDVVAQLATELATRRAAAAASAVTLAQKRRAR